MPKRPRKPKTDRAGRPTRGAAEPTAGIRIIGGTLGGRRLRYQGDPRTRPMKDRLRESVFNLIGPAVRGKHALDLFAGTGALGIEALSRGEPRATLIEQHRPTAAMIRQNLVELGVAEQAEVVAGNVFIWWRRQQGAGFGIQGSETDAERHAPESSNPQIPKSLNPFQAAAANREPDMHSSSLVPHPSSLSPALAGVLFAALRLLRRAPGGDAGADRRAAAGGAAESIFVVEADNRFDFQTLPEPSAWNVRSYPPAVVGIRRGGAG